jgi:Spy/CpxP family protein refolding chaperone
MTFGALASASAHGGGKCGAKRAKHIAMALKAAGVSDVVQGNVQTLFKDFKAAKKAIKADLKAKRMALHELLQAATLDNVKIDALANEIADLKSKKIKDKIQMLSKVSALLNAEERGKFFGHLKQHWGKGKGKGRGCACGSK